MSHSFRLIIVAGAVLVSGLVCVQPALAQKADLAEARAAFEHGQELFISGDYSAAAKAFKEAYEIRPFPQFLFNVGASYEKLGDYEKAVFFYERYVQTAGQASDTRDVKKRIKVLKGELSRQKEATAPATQPGETPATQPTTEGETPAKPTEPSPEMAALTEVKLHGLVVIESQPPGAFIYVDSKKEKPIGTTPWHGALEGSHTVFIERKGFEQAKRKIQPTSDKLLVLFFGLAEEDYLGWIDIRSNIPGANIYIDDKSVGVYRQTPYSGNIPPGKHTIWVTADGYDESVNKITIVPGKTHKIFAKLTGTPVGYLDIRGPEVSHATIYVDGKVLCERGPCRKPVPRGKHSLSIRRDGYKSLDRSINIQEKTQMSLRADLAEKPGRGDAVWAYIFSGVFLGGGIYLGLQAKSIQDDLASDIATGMPPTDPGDERFQRGKLFAYGADAAYALAGISFVTALYYTFRDKGPPSTSSTEVRTVSAQPEVRPGYAGLGVQVAF